MTRHPFRSLIPAVALTLLTLPAFALPATTEGAKRIEGAFATYLGPAAAAISVLPQGDSYSLTFDAAPLFDMVKDEGVTGTATSLVFLLTDQGGGFWDVALDQKASFEVHVPEALDLVETIGTVAMTGTFDERLMSFTKAEGSFSRVSVQETVTVEGESVTHALITLDNGTFSSTAQAGNRGGVDSSFTLEAKGLTEELESPMEPGQPPVPLTIRAETMRQTGTMTGLRANEVMALLAWGVAQFSPEAGTPDRAEAKALVAAAMPLFDTLDSSAGLTLLSVDTPMGAVGITEAGFRVAANGLVADGRVLEGITVKGVTLPAGLVPAWVEPLIPQDLALEGELSGYDAAAAVAEALTALDLPEGTDPAPGFEDQILAALLPQGVVTFRLNQGGASSGRYALTWEGQLEAGPATEVPPFTAKVSLKGMEAIISALNGAPDDMKLPAMMGLGAARGIAKPGEGGALSWEIDGMTPGTVLVNGMDISQIGGGN